MNIGEIQNLRQIFPLKLYEETGGSRWISPKYPDIGNSSGIDAIKISTVLEYFGHHST